MAAPKKKPSIVFDKKPASPFTDKLKTKPKTDWVEKMKADNGVSSKDKKGFDKFKISDSQVKDIQKRGRASAPDSSGPKMGKAGNSNKKPKPSITFKDKPVKAAPSTRFADAAKKAQEIKSAPKAAVDLKSGDLRSQTLKNGGVTPKAAPKVDPNAGKTFWKNAAGKTVTTPRALATGAGKLLSAGSKLLGKANPVIGQITSAKSLNVGENEWLANKGPLMAGNKKYDKPIGPSKPASTYSGYGTFNPPMPKAPSGSGMSFGNTPLSSNKTKAAPATSAPSGGGSTPASAKNPNVGTSGMSGTTTKRGGVTTLQTKYQRDDLAMNQRKRK